MAANPLTLKQGIIVVASQPNKGIVNCGSPLVKAGRRFIPPIVGRYRGSLPLKRSPPLSTNLNGHVSPNGGMARKMGLDINACRGGVGGGNDVSGSGGFF